MYIVGEIKTIIGEDIPECFIECDGQELETERYPALFAKIGYEYGGGGSHFNLPRSKDVAPHVGRGNRRQTHKAIICVSAESIWAGEA